ncbi:hypothetical protein QO002_002331 [Pararhizobium capsulatum DSM 1112]|uniref:SPOR domain-containing protein n=1 Tax=Pararhizobium capsulatum DSM 1112 TaxID=1121113 RepID=A0ABU0BPN1_9HYPH|nr:hypothetical protein [Pararhizobium capsulatum DSM 1112]
MARNGTTEFDLFSDDDPLSELARIVGYDNRPAMQQLQELEKHRNTVRQDPVLDLEDELLREFETYDQPVAMPPVDPAVEEATWAEPATFAEPAASESHEASFEQSWNVEPDVIVEAEVPPLAEASEHTYAEPVYVEPVFEEPVRTEAVHAEPTFESIEIDLERELELSIGYDEEFLPSAAEPTESETHVASVEPEIEPQFDMPAEIFSDVAVEEPVLVAPLQEEFHAVVEQAPVAPVEADSQAASGAELVDALLADIERFPVPTKAPAVAIAPQTPLRKNNYPFTPMFSRATPVVSSTGAGQKAYAAPMVAAAPVVTAVAPSVASTEIAVEPILATETAFAPEEVAAEPIVVAAAHALVQPAEPDFDLDAFELDLSDIDLDLDPMEVQALERGELAAPVVAEAAPVEVPVSKAAPAAWDLNPADFVIPEPVVEMPSRTVVSEPVIEADFAVEDSQSDSELPFDPAMIAEAEESLAAIAELDVPQLPVVEQEKPVAYQPDYDLDIDAEMAQLFGTPARSARNVEHGHDERLFSGVAHPASAAPAATTARVEDDFDAFEKAMEEDFRQSLSPRQEMDPASDRLAVGYGYAAEDDYAEERQSSGVRRIALLAATVAGIAILGGAGVYAWMGGSAPGLSGGDPKVILADKTPVKIVPVEKGGKTVPNQDKAVYDRVAGAANDLPQQGALVSSTEEPVDVVQRTLTPENLPLEGRGDEPLPGVTEDEDGNRLMPDGDVAANTAPQEDSSPAVSPRKVRTMIVKPDGTLVAREDIAPAAAAEDVAQTEPAVTPVKTTTITPATKTERSALAEAADVQVEETAPVRPVATTTVTETETAAVPQARPVVEKQAVVEKPAVAEQTASTPVVETPAPVQTAAVAPGSYVIQIASLPSEAEAQKSYNTLSGKFGSVIGGRGVDIKKAEIAGKGTYYRVRIPAGSKQDANELCSRYKSAGGSCLVTR